MRQSILRSVLAGAAALTILSSAAWAQTAAPTAPTGPQASVPMGPVSVADLAERLIGSVVNISTAQNVTRTPGGPGARPQPRAPEGSPFQDFFDEFFKQQDPSAPGLRPRKVQSLGSGFVIDAAGVIVTNNHVIADADEITVEFTDGTKLKAEVVGTDPKTDLAVLKVEPVKPLQAAAFGASERSRVGDWVMAIGNPFGQGSSVSLGIISAINRDISSGPYDAFIQTDAAINRGNSGGPLFNMRGEVIGINTAIISPTGGSIGLGFSIPSKLAVNVIEQLREFGETRRGWLGVSIQPVTDDIAESLSMNRARGALVAGLTPKGPAKNSGIQVGDVILSFDAKSIDEMRDLPRIVADTPVGKTVDVVVLRKGEEQTVSVTLGRLEDGEKLIAAQKSDESQADAKVAALGMTFIELTDEEREARGIGADIKGVVISEVEPGSAAAEKGIKEGSVLSEVAQEAVTSPEDVLKRLEALKKEGRKKALLLIATKDGELSFVVLDT